MFHQTPGPASHHNDTLGYGELTVHRTVCTGPATSQPSLWNTTMRTSLSMVGSFITMVQSLSHDIFGFGVMIIPPRPETLEGERRKPYQEHQAGKQLITNSLLAEQLLC